MVYIFIKSNNNVVNMGFTISASLHDCDLLGGMNLVKKSVWFFFCLFFRYVCYIGREYESTCQFSFCNMKVFETFKLLR